jgi:hypothetical protein
VTVIYISNNHWTNLKVDNETMVMINFPNYTKFEAVEIMASKKTFENSKSKQNFIKKMEILYDNVSLVTTDLKEIISSADRCDTDNLLNQKDKKMIFDNIFSQIYLSKKKKLKRNEKNYEKKNSSISKISIFLLISSFLAYHNPPSMDSRFFTLESNIKKATKRKSKEVHDPTSFPLSRLLKIFSFISLQHFSDLQIKPRESPLVLARINDLVQQKHLTLMSGKDNIDEIKYKCNCEKYFIEEISSQVSFPFQSFLYHN